jgi:hypothetical protein
MMHPVAHMLKLVSHLKPPAPGQSVHEFSATKANAFTWLTATALAVCALGCAAQPATIKLGERLVLRVGESAVSPEAQLQMGVLAVTADSRCPKGVQCVWAGAATVQVWIQPAAGARSTVELRSSAGGSRAERVGGLELRLENLDPYPTAGKAIAAGAYQATLVLSRPSKGPAGGEAER